MSDRERWIVYPLLFLALGAALRDKLFPVDDFDRAIRCRELDVVGDDGQTRIRLGAAPNRTGQIQVIGPQGRPLVLIGADEAARTGMVELQNQSGAKQIVLAADPLLGGTVLVYDPSERSAAGVTPLGFLERHNSPSRQRPLPQANPFPQLRRGRMSVPDSPREPAPSSAKPPVEKDATDPPSPTKDAPRNAPAAEPDAPRSDSPSPSPDKNPPPQSK